MTSRTMKLQKGGRKQSKKDTFDNSDYQEQKILINKLWFNVKKYSMLTNKTFTILF